LYEHDECLFKEISNNALCGVVYNYFRYVIPNKTDTNKRRWSDTTYWQKFIQSAEKIRIYQKPGIEYNEINLETFVLRNSGNSINVFRKIYGDKNLIRALDLIDSGANYSLKQQKLMEKYKGKAVQTPGIITEKQMPADTSRNKIHSE